VRILAGDIGATKSLVALFETGPSAGAARGAEGDSPVAIDLHLIREERFESGAYSRLEEIVTAFIGPDSGAGIEAACFGIAGPIVGGESRAVNLAWQVHRDRLARAIGIPRTRLVNDFQAVGHGIECLRPQDLVSLQDGRTEPRGPIALIGAGTGLGEGFLTWTPSSYRVHPSEGGHCDFAPRTTCESDILDYLRARHGHVSYERVLSGPGLSALYRFVIETQGIAESPRVSEEMAGGDPAPVITRHALARTDEACARTLDLFISVYGAEAGNLALKILPTGGLYVAGGIAPRIVERMRDGGFIEAFRDKGRHAGILETIPVRVVMNAHAGLLGAAAIASRT